MALILQCSCRACHKNKTAKFKIQIQDSVPGLNNTIRTAGLHTDADAVKLIISVSASIASASSKWIVRLLLVWSDANVMTNFCIR